MNEAVWKYLLPSEGAQVQMPKGAKILDAQIQGNTICLWAQVTPEFELETRRFLVYGTGHYLRPEILHTYIATIQDGEFVWHVFEVRI